MNCPKCGFQLADGSKFCQECGAKLGAVAEMEVAPVQEESKPASAPLPDDIAIIRRYLTSQLSDKIMATKGKIEGERRQVTALFVDIKGYTTLSEKLGEEAIYRLMERLYEVMITAVHEEEGNVQKLTGDGIFALFGAPIALEDAPLRACRAGVAIQEKMKALGDELMKEQNIRPLARIGIHTGPVVIGAMGTDLRMEFTALGDTVNLASRMESIAEPGSVYISEATHNLAGPYIESSFVGEKQIKGKTELQKVYRVDGLKAHTVRFDVSLERGLTPLVGRAQELETLMEHCDLGCKGKTLLVQLVGEPGVGKSRVMHEFHKRIAEKQVYYLRANCMSYGQTTPFLPFIEIVKGLFQINDNDGRELVEGKLKQGLELLGMDAKDMLFFLILFGFDVKNEELKGLDAKLIGDRTRDALTAVISNRAKRSPLVLAIEDLHWIDPASEQLLHQMLTSPLTLTLSPTGRGDIPLMLLCTTRPAYKAPWLTNPNVKIMKLDPLSKDNAKQLVGALLGSEHVTEEVNAMILEKAGGNPFFTEEMTRYLLERGGLKKSEKAITYELEAGKSFVPTSILDLLQSRIDRLDETLKTILQTAAVIGQRFSPDLVKKVSGLNGTFNDLLGDLEKRDLIFPERVGTGTEYRFKHALLQDVVYDGMLKPRREALHLAVAETIENLYSDRLNEWAETLAHHFSNTGQAIKAARYTFMAGEKSFKYYALQEADQRFRKAIELIDSVLERTDDALLADALNSWARVFWCKQDFKGMIAAVEKYLVRVEALKDNKRIALLFFWLGVSYNSGGQGRKGRAVLERAKVLSKEVGDELCYARACAGLLWTFVYWTPDHEEAKRMFEVSYHEALELGSKINDSFTIYQCYQTKAIYEANHCRLEESKKYCDKMMELGEKCGDKRYTAAGMWMNAMCDMVLERFPEALTQAEQALALSSDPMDQLCSLVTIGAVKALTGKGLEGYEILTQVRTECFERDFYFPLTGFEIPYGAVMALNGQFSKGLRHIENAKKWFASLGNYTHPVWGDAFLGEIYMQMAIGSPPPLAVILKNFWFVLTNKPVAKRKARLYLEKTLQQSKVYGMTGFVAKSLYSLGLLAQSSKKHQEARTYFEEALKVAEENELFIAEKVKAALNSLNALIAVKR